MSLPLAPLLSTLPAFASKVEPFSDGDRWTVIGDSITQSGTYSMWVKLYYATRFPERHLDLFNAGNSGDSASGGVRRYDWDIQPHKSTVATLMFGMNDVRRELYDDTQSTPELEERRAAALEDFRVNTTTLARRLKADGARVILVSPSIYDETSKFERPTQTGVNAALGECESLLKQIADEVDAEVIDVHTPMTELGTRLQAKDPAISLTRPDRVHPNDLGNFVVAYFFLKAQGVPGVVSSVSIDANTAHVNEIDNASVTAFVARDRDLSFTLLARALPFPVGKEVEPALAWVPFQREFNREMLWVTGLAPGDYQLLIDGQEIRRYHAEELAYGVNVALEKNTPQAIQAARVLDLAHQWQKLMAQKVRLIAQFEFWRLGDVAHPVNFEAVRPRLEAELDRLKQSVVPTDQTEHDFFQRYYDTKPKENENLTQLADIEQQMRSACQPIPHRWELKPVPNIKGR